MYEGLDNEIVTLMKKYIEIDEIIKFMEGAADIWIGSRPLNFVKVNDSDRSYRLEKSLSEKFLYTLRKERSELFGRISDP